MAATKADEHPEGWVQVVVRGPGAGHPGGGGRIFTGETRPNDKDNPFPTYQAGDKIWLPPETAEKYEFERLVNYVE